MERLSSELITKMENFPLKTSLKNNTKDIKSSNTLQLNIPIIDNGINGSGIDSCTGFNVTTPISLGDVINIYNKPFNVADRYIMSVYNNNHNTNIMIPINLFIIGFSVLSFTSLIYICFRHVKSQFRCGKYVLK
jgi:hypothetical protein